MSFHLLSHRVSYRDGLGKEGGSKGAHERQRRGQGGVPGTEHRLPVGPLTPLFSDLDTSQSQSYPLLNPHTHTHFYRSLPVPLPLVHASDVLSNAFPSIARMTTRSFPPLLSTFALVLIKRSSRIHVSFSFLLPSKQTHFPVLLRARARLFLCVLLLHSPLTVLCRTVSHVHLHDSSQLSLTYLKGPNFR